MKCKNRSIKLDLIKKRSILYIRYQLQYYTQVVSYSMTVTLMRIARIDMTLLSKSLFHKKYIEIVNGFTIAWRLIKVIRKSINIKNTSDPILIH